MNGSKVLTGTRWHFFGEAVVLPPLLSFVDLGLAIVFSRTRIGKVERWHFYFLVLLESREFHSANNNSPQLHPPQLLEHKENIKKLILLEKLVKE